MAPPTPISSPKVAERRACHEEQRARGEEDDYRRPHVRLGDDQAADDSEKQHERHEPQRELVDVFPAARQPGRDIDDHRELGELAWLERQRTEAPASAARRYARRRVPVPARRPAPPAPATASARSTPQPVVVQPHEHDHCDDAEQREHRLPHHEVVGVAELVVTHGEAGCVHGEQAGDHQHRRRHKQHVVRRPRRRAARPAVLALEVYGSDGCTSPSAVSGQARPSVARASGSARRAARSSRRRRSSCTPARAARRRRAPPSSRAACHGFCQAFDARRTVRAVLSAARNASSSLPADSPKSTTARQRAHRLARPARPAAISCRAHPGAARPAPQRNECRPARARASSRCCRCSSSTPPTSATNSRRCGTPRNVSTAQAIASGEIAAGRRDGRRGDGVRLVVASAQPKRIQAEQPSR